MKKIDPVKLNRSNADIWASIIAGMESRNFALIEKNLKRLAALQKYYIKLLNLQEHEIRELQNELKADNAVLRSYEREWFSDCLKRSGTYEQMKDRLDEIFKQ